MTDSEGAPQALPAADLIAADALAMFDALLASTPAGVGFLDRELRYVRVNGRLAALNGLPPEAHLGRTVREVVPAFADAAEALAGRIAATGETIREYPVELRGAGGSHHLVCTLFPVADPDGQVRWIGIVVIDATERALAEQALRESEERFRLAARAARDVVWDWNLADDTVTAAEGVARVFGFSETQMDDSTGWWEAQLHPEDRERVLVSIAAALREGDRWTEEYRHRRADGSYAVVVDRAYVVRDERGRAVRMVGVTTDVTQERATAAALAASEARFRSVFESPMIGIGFWGGGRVWEANDALLRLLGYTREELEAGMIVTGRLTPPEYRTRDLQALRHAEAYGAVIPYEKEFFRRDGSRIPVLVGGAPFDAPPATAIFFVLDNSALRDAREATHAAQRMETVGRLAGGVAHEVNNALQGVLGFTDFVLRAVDRGRVDRADVEQIRAAALRAADVTRQLLAFSRRQLLSPTRLDLDALAAALLPILRQAAGPRCELRVARAPAPVFVSADRAQLEQAFVNVVLNARDAMPDGGRLAIAVGERELAATDLAGVSDPPPPGRYGFVEFADTGIGMDDAVRARMFEPFFTTRPAGTATGLGLSVVYGIVRQSGGLVTCESAPGAGATFRLYLPVAGVASRPPSS